MLKGLAAAGKNLDLVDDTAWELAAHNRWTPEQLTESSALLDRMIELVD